MSIKNVVFAQYKEMVNQVAALVSTLKVPPEGWVRTVRKALGMSGAQLAARLNVSRALVSRTENEELKGAVTLKAMHKMAEAMGCHFVYAIVPDKKIEDLIFERAKLLAIHIVKQTNVQMALEDQLLSNEKIKFEIERLTQEIIKNHDANLWDSAWES